MLHLLHFGAVVTVPLIAGLQVVVPDGVCNGFQTVADTSQYLHCFDAEWQPGMTGVAVHPLDPELAIAWPLPPVLSEDACATAAHAAVAGPRHGRVTTEPASEPSS